MPSLKEIKTRILSVRSTRKITSAMMMISSSKLRKTQNIIEKIDPYAERVFRLMNLLLNSERDFTSPFSVQRPVKHVAIVAFSSNSSLAGRFNDNVTDELKSAVSTYQHLGKENIFIYPVGDKVQAEAKKMGFHTLENFHNIAQKPAYEATQQLSSDLMMLFRERMIDKVELIYHHYKSKTTQVVTRETFLPMELQQPAGGENSEESYYIVEPDKKTVLEQLIPKALKLKLFTVHTHSVASEHAARTMAMQIATDNAEDLIDELTLQFNKLRQQTITNELLDIIGGSFGKMNN